MRHCRACEHFDSKGTESIPPTSLESETWDEIKGAYARGELVDPLYNNTQFLLEDTMSSDLDLYVRGRISRRMAFPNRRHDHEHDHVEEGPNEHIFQHEQL